MKTVYNRAASAKKQQGFCKKLGRLSRQLCTISKTKTLCPSKRRHFQLVHLPILLQSPQVVCTSCFKGFSGRVQQTNEASGIATFVLKSNGSGASGRAGTATTLSRKSLYFVASGVGHGKDECHAACREGQCQLLFGCLTTRYSNDTSSPGVRASFLQDQKPRTP